MAASVAATAGSAYPQDGDDVVGSLPFSSTPDCDLLTATGPYDHDHDDVESEGGQLAEDAAVDAVEEALTWSGNPPRYIPSPVSFVGSIGSGVAPLDASPVPSRRRVGLFRGSAGSGTASVSSAGRFVSSPSLRATVAGAAGGAGGRHDDGVSVNLSFSVAGGAGTEAGAGTGEADYVEDMDLDVEDEGAEVMDPPSPSSVVFSAI